MSRASGADELARQTEGGMGRDAGQQLSSGWRQAEALKNDEKW